VEVVVSRALPASVLVTGASGFLGRHVCVELIRRGVTVRGLVRRPEADLVPGVVAQPARGLDDREALRKAVQGVEGVVHLAARVHQAPGADDAAAHRTVNLDGTRNLLDAAAGANVKSFVFFSSVKVMGESTEAPWTERDVPRPAGVYGATKLEAEAAVRAAAELHRMHAPVLRLPLVYGPGMTANALKLFQEADRGTPLPLGSVRNQRSLLFTGNLVAALVAVLTHEGGDDVFFVSDGQDVSTPELIGAVARALGRPARLVPVPVGLLRAAGRFGDLVGRVAPFRLTTPAVDRLAGSLAVDITKLRRQAEYSPPYSVADGLRVTAEWYRTRFKDGV
jgi:UDP-N-acetyl-alpha-D-quinovosamine dehydrogenase